MLEMIQLKKHFQISRDEVLHAVDGINLKIETNEVLGLVGESGCGKSTLGRTLVGLYDKTSGQVLLNGSPLPQRYNSQDFKRYSREIQMIFQDPYSSLNPRMTVQDVIAEGPLIHGLWAKANSAQNVAQWLERVGLHPDHRSRYPHEFSGGQRQRIGIARALALRPKIIVCDEPISALDVSVQAQIINLLEDLKRSMGLTLLFIAHDLSMVRYVSDRMAVMYLGKIVELGGADDVYFNPIHPYTRTLIAANPHPDPRTERRKPHALLEGEIASPVNPKPGCRFANRCAQATEICRTTDPEWRQVKPTHFAACHLYD